MDKKSAPIGVNIGKNATTPIEKLMKTIYTAWKNI